VERAAADGDAAWTANEPLLAAAGQLRSSLEAVEHRIRSGAHGCYIRSSALVALALDTLRPRHSPLQHALRDLTLVDGALARLATALQMDVADHDTSPGTGSTIAEVAGTARSLRAGPPAVEPG
jgi:hypothetical protein